MAKFSLTKRAIADLVDIAGYTENHWGQSSGINISPSWIVVFSSWLQHLPREEIELL